MVIRHPRGGDDQLSRVALRSGGDALDVQFSGADARRLKRASEALQTALARYPEVSAVEDTLSYDKEELVLELTPQAGNLWG